MTYVRCCLLCLWLLSSRSALAAEPVPGKGRNPEAVEQVAAGELTTANASWWGFDSEDATDALQGAIDSKAKKVIVPFMGEPWTVRPIMLRSHLELVFEPGVMVLAKKGEFKDEFQLLLRKGFMRVRLDGEFVDLSEEISLDKNQKHE